MVQAFSNALPANGGKPWSVSHAAVVGAGLSSPAVSPCHAETVLPPTPPYAPANTWHGTVADASPSSVAAAAAQDLGDSGDGVTATCVCREADPARVNLSVVLTPS